MYLKSISVLLFAAFSCALNAYADGDTKTAKCQDGDTRSTGGKVEICMGKQGWKTLIADKAETGSSLAARHMVPSLLGNLWTMVGEPEIKGDHVIVPATILNRSCRITLRKAPQSPDGWNAENIDCKPI